MLLNFIRSRNASQRSPLRENRLLFFASPAGSTPPSSQPSAQAATNLEQEKLKFQEELDRRAAAAPAGTSLFGTVGDTPEARLFGVKILYEASKKQDADKIAGTNITAGEVKTSDAALTLAITQRVRYAEKAEKEETVIDMMQRVNRQIQGTVDGDTTPEAATVQGEADATRGAAADVLNDEQEEVAEAPKIRNAAETLERMNSLDRKLEAAIKALREFSKSKPKDVSDDEWNEQISFLKDRQTDLYRFYDAIRTLAAWESGELSPAEFARWAKDNLYKGIHGFPQEDADKTFYGQRTKQAEDVVKNANGDVTALSPMTVAGQDLEKRLPKLDSANAWKAYNASTRNLVIRAFKDEIFLDTDNLSAIQKILDHANEQVDLIQGALEKNPQRKQIIETAQKAMLEEERLKQIEKETGKASPSFREIWQGINKALGIEWYSPLQMWQAFQDTKEAFKRAWKAKDDRKSALFASKIGSVIQKVLPFGMGNEIAQSLDADLSDRNSKEKNGFKEYLAGNNTLFTTVFDPGGTMDEYKHNPNKARGILEFAAEKGWLYDFPTQAKSGVKPEDALVMGKWRYRELVSDMGDTDAANYYYSLQFMNGAGKDKSIEGGSKFVHDLDKPEPFIEALKGSLKGHDYWSAVGMMKRAFERGMEGELSPWLTITVMDHVKKDPFAQRFISGPILEAMGTVGAYTTAFTVGYLRFEKDQILEWARSGAKEMNEAGTFGKIYKAVSEDIISKDDSYAKDDEKNQADLQRTIAKVLAAQTVELRNGRQVNIFAPRYNFYNNGSGQQRETEVGKLDSDFYVNRSETMLSDENIVVQILDYRSQGGFQEEARAVGFLNNIFTLNQELSRSQEQELQNGGARFRQVMGRKLEVWLKKALTSSNQKWLVDYKPKGRNKQVLKELIETGFLDVKFFDKPGTWGGQVLQMMGVAPKARPKPKAAGDEE